VFRGSVNSFISHACAGTSYTKILRPSSHSRFQMQYHPNRPHSLAVLDVFGHLQKAYQPNNVSQPLTFVLIRHFILWQRVTPLVGVTYNRRRKNQPDAVRGTIPCVLVTILGTWPLEGLRKVIRFLWTKQILSVGIHRLSYGCRAAAC
jgi:hypothetical protein